jgi:hypothetical protein
LAFQTVRSPTKIPGPKNHPVDRGRVAILDNRVLAIATSEIIGIGARAADQRVIALAANENIVTAPALDDIVAVAAGDVDA